MNGKLKILKNDELENVSGSGTSILKTAVGVVIGAVLSYGMYKAVKFGKDVYNNLHKKPSDYKYSNYTDFVREKNVKKVSNCIKKITNP